MKKFLFTMVALAFLTGCSFHNGLTHNENHHSTEVVLSQKNFEVISSVQGKSTATYVFIFGGLKKSALIAEARAEMIAKADLVGSSRALINETCEIKSTGITPFFNTFTVIVSAQVIEFTK